jgi:nitrite reductase (cytochrome c-552)
VCHRQETAKLLANVFERQDKLIENRDKLEEILVRAHVEAKAAWDKGATEAEMKDALQDIRHAQWRWDYVAAGHGSSFHAPVEMARVVASGINIAQEARLKLSRILVKYGVNQDVQYPDISTKEKAQKFIGLDVDKMEEQKAEFMKTIVPKWQEEAAKRENAWGIKYL